VDEEVERLRTVEDPVERARRATELLSGHQAALKELSRLRREAIEDMLASGMTQAKVATLLNLTRSRVGQLMSSGPPPERAFFGIEAITVAVALKEEAGKSRPTPVVAQEDFYAANALKELAQTLQLDAEFEHIAPPGNVLLNRPNLVVICGPRLSPLIAQILESDTNLRFVNDRTGWYLIDHGKGGVIHRSPMDSDGAGDVAYLGRLPRPDGRGAFLYIAGIHAMGSSGVVHWLSGHVAEIYREVRDRRFSTLISCEFDPATRQVTASERVSRVYRHDG